MSRRPIALLVASVVVTLGACGGDGEQSAPTTSSTVPPMTTTIAPDYSRPSSPTQVTTGLLEGTSPDGSALYVSALDQALSPRGCEGQPEPVLFRMPLSGGARQAVGSPGEPVRGTVLRGADRRIALVAGCEEFLSVVRVGTESPDGQLRELRRLDLGQLGPRRAWRGPATGAPWWPSPGPSSRGVRGRWSGWIRALARPRRSSPRSAR